MNPYQNLPEKAFWKTAVAEKPIQEIHSIWQPKFTLSPEDGIVTAGSCFAQHISRHLVAQGYHWLDGEPAPYGLSDKSKLVFNYGVFSFRTGNIYSTALLKQWVTWAFTKCTIPNEIWRKGGRFYDPFRPNIEPYGFASVEELLASRDTTLKAIKKTLTEAHIFVFTLGLTEAWIHKTKEYIYPACPGTIAGEFDANQHQFVNYSYMEIFKDLFETFKLIKTANPKIKFLLTVSPVPLTATASPQHVLTATYYSKSTLRAVAGDLASRRLDTDYFPSYELISSFPMGTTFYKENLRQVKDEGVEFVMRSFFACLGVSYQPSASKAKAKSAEIKLESAKPPSRAKDKQTVVCEDELLNAFSPKTKP